MINRYIPYGYYVQDAQIRINESEASVIRTVFHDYISGASLKGLASQLTMAGTEFLPGRSDWDANRVYRLLCNEKYAGKNEFSPIVAQDVFLAAQDIRGGRNQYQKGQEEITTITDAVAPILCGICGAPAKRHRGQKGKYPQKYVCSNPDCNREYRFSDSKMTAQIQHLLQIADIQPPICGESSLEVRRAENEIKRLLDSPDADPEEIRSRIFDLAAERYRLLTAGFVITDKLRTALTPANLSSSNIRKTVMETVKEIRLTDDEALEITLINDQIVREAQVHGTSTTAKNCAGHPADDPAGAGKTIQ